MKTHKHTHPSPIWRSFQAGLLVIATLFITACSKPIEKSIIGKWEKAGETAEFEFFNDGTILMIQDEQKISGTWVKVGDKRIKIEGATNGTKETVVFEDIEISGNQMKIKFNGKDVSVTRKK